MCCQNFRNGFQYILYTLIVFQKASHLSYAVYYFVVNESLSPKKRAVREFQAIITLKWKEFEGLWAI